MKTNLKRCWINQPSTLQPLHKKHRVNVLAEDTKENTVKIYYIHGAVISSIVPRNVLSNGWK